MNSYQPDLLPDPEDPAGVADQWEAKLNAANGAEYTWPPSGRVVQWGRQWAQTGQLPDDLPEPLRDYATAAAAQAPQPRAGNGVSLRFSPEQLPSHEALTAARRAMAEQEGDDGPTAPALPWPAGRVALRWLRVLKYGAAGVLLERYLAEIAPVPRWNALRAEERQGMRTLAPENAAEAGDLFGRIDALHEYRNRMVPEPELYLGERPEQDPDLPRLRPDADPPVGMHPDDADAARDEVARLTAHPGRGWRLHRELVLVRQLHGWLRPMTEDEREAVCLKFLGAQEDGSPRPTLGEYLRATGWAHLAEVALYRLRQDVRQEQQEGGEIDAELQALTTELTGTVEAPPPTPEETQGAPVFIDELGDRVLWTQGIRAAIGPIHTQAAGALARADEGQLNLLGNDTPTRLKRWAAADVDMDVRQLAELNTNHWRALWGALHVFSSQADWHLWEGTAVVPWKTLCNAAGVDPRQTSQVRRLYQAMDELSAMTVHTIVHTEGEGGGTFATRAPLVRMVARWNDESRDRTAQRKLAEYRRTGTWKGPPPDEVSLKLDGPMRYTVKAMALPADFLTRMTEAAQDVRGGNQGIRPLDMLLYFELVRPGVRQGAHTAPDGVPYSYLYRDKFLEETRGGAASEARSRGAAAYRARIVAPYLEAVDVLLRAGIVRDWTPDYQARNGKRDRFEVPDPTLPDPTLPGPKSA